jgi:hypothetical protein
MEKNVPRVLDCAGCGARLRLRDDAAGQRFSCPRCLTPMATPGSADESIADVLPAGPPRRPRRRVDYRAADVDVHRDTGRAALGLGLLGILILVAVALTVTGGFATGHGFWWADSKIGQSSSSSKVAENLVPWALLAAGFVALIAPAPVLVNMFRGHDVGAGRVVLGIVLYFVIFCTTAVALPVIFFLACVAGLGTK